MTGDGNYIDSNNNNSSFVYSTIHLGSKYTTAPHWEMEMSWFKWERIVGDESSVAALLWIE